MARLTHSFNIKGVENTAYYLDSVDLETVQKANNGDQIDGKDGLYSAYIQFEEDGILVSIEYKNFTNNDVTAWIPVQIIMAKYTLSGSFLSSKLLKTPNLTGAEYVDFYNLLLPNGVPLGYAINVKILNYMTNFAYGNADDNYIVYAFDPATLQGWQPVLFTVAQTVFNETGGNIEVTVSDSDGDCTYSIDNVNFQASNVFENLTSGQYTIYVKDQSKTNSRTFKVTSDIE